VSIDDPPWQKSENLTALLVKPKHPRSVLKTRGEEAEKGVNCYRPRTSSPVHRAADPPRAARLAFHHPQYVLLRRPLGFKRRIQACPRRARARQGQPAPAMITTTEVSTV
jgi:hypothetical protein